MCGRQRGMEAIDCVHRARACRLRSLSSRRPPFKSRIRPRFVKLGCEAPCGTAKDADSMWLEGCRRRSDRSDQASACLRCAAMARAHADREVRPEGRIGGEGTRRDPLPHSLRCICPAAGSQRALLHPDSSRLSARRTSSAASRPPSVHRTPHASPASVCRRSRGVWPCFGCVRRAARARTPC